MQQNAAKKIDEGIGREAPPAQDRIWEAMQTEVRPPALQYDPYKSKIRRPGTGGIYQINDHLYEGRYTPTNARGRREVHTVYAKTREEVEPLLEEMIRTVREQIRMEKAELRSESTE